MINVKSIKELDFNASISELIEGVEKVFYQVAEKENEIARLRGEEPEEITMIQWMNNNLEMVAEDIEDLTDREQFLLALGILMVELPNRMGIEI